MSYSSERLLRLCDRCLKWWPEDKDHGGYPEPHTCTPVPDADVETIKLPLHPAIASGVWTDIANELRRANELHPNYPWPRDPVRCVGIIAEEVGESMREALDLTRGEGQPNRHNVLILDRLYRETVECAVTSIRLLLAMKGATHGG